MFRGLGIRVPSHMPGWIRHKMFFLLGPSWTLVHSAGLGDNVLLTAMLGPKPQKE